MSVENPRTSNTHPIRVDWLDFEEGPKLGMTFAPGKVQHDGRTGPWRRNLDADLDHLANHYRVNDLVCLVEHRELEWLQIEDLAERCEAHGIVLHRSPIRDMGVPTNEAMRALVEKISTLRSEGRQVVVHCMGGLGRTGTVAACCLVLEGVPPENAIARVRSARKGTIETLGQEQFIHDFANRAASEC